MPKTMRKCKVCGKEYEYCKTWAPSNKFRYQDVACSPECGSKYFALVEAARSGAAEQNDKAEKKVPKKIQKKPAVIANDDNSAIENVEPVHISKA